MAQINKKAAVTRATGLPSKEQIMTAPQNTDTVPAVITGQGGEQAPAALTEGEFVFSLPAIIALGEGNYDAGLEKLNQVHEQLRAMGDEMLQAQQGGQGLAAAGI